MSTIHNSDLIKGISKNAALQLNIDNPPNKLADKVVPTMETNPECLRKVTRIFSATATNATGATILASSTSETREFFIVGAMLNLIKDATSTSTTSEIQVTLDEQTAAQPIIKIPTITLTAEVLSASITLPIPCKIKKGSVISIANSTNVANISATGIIYGYYVETSLA